MRMSHLPGDGQAVRYRFGEFTYDCDSQTLLRNGEEQRLSPKARQLLRMLLLNRPKAVSREEIYDALWPSTFVCETNMATVVSELRRVLGDDARSAQYIRTVHGFGYAFAVAEVKKQSADVEWTAILRCEGRRMLLYEGDNVIGRELDCDVVLNDVTVSRRHAIITIRGDSMTIQDQDSRNGTFVNGQRITRSGLRERDRIRFGAAPAILLTKVSETRPLEMSIPDFPSDSGDEIVLADLFC